MCEDLPRVRHGTTAIAIADYGNGGGATPNALRRSATRRRVTSDDAMAYVQVATLGCCSIEYPTD